MTNDDPSNEHRPQRSFGRVKGRPLSLRQAGLVEALLPHLAVPEEGAIDLDELFAPPPLWGRAAWGGSQEETQASMAYAFLHSPDQSKAPHPLTPPHEGEGGAQTILEIGFGAGEHLVAQAQAHPDARFIGVEPFLNGIAACLAQIEDAGVQNIRLHEGDGRDVVARLPDASLDLVYILFPDPWPKKRHWKRRLIQAEFLDELARVLKPGAEIRFATDWKHYAAAALETFVNHPRFVWLAERAGDWRTPWGGHVSTRYEEKKLGDTAPIFLRFSRS